MTIWQVSDAAAIREVVAHANLNLDTMAKQSAADVAITGGSVMGLDTLSVPPDITPTWTATHAFEAGIALADTPIVPVSVSTNPWFIDDSLSMATIYATAASATEPETGLQIFMTSALGYGASPEPFKVAFFAVNHALPGAPSSYTINGVLDIESGVDGINGIVGEFDINVRNQHYGDTAGAVNFPYAAPAYFAHGGSKRATAPLMIQCVSAGTGDMPWNFGVVAFGGSIRQHFLADFTDSEGVLYANGTKTKGIDLSAATISGNAFASPGFSVSGAGAIVALNVLSGTYTPTLTNVANTSGRTAYSSVFSRVGNVGRVAGKMDVTTVAGAPTLTQVRISLPIPSALTASHQLAGGCWSGDIQTGNGMILADAANDAALVSFITSSAGTFQVAYSFDYPIL